MLRVRPVTQASVNIVTGRAAIEFSAAGSTRAGSKRGGNRDEIFHRRKGQERARVYRRDPRRRKFQPRLGRSYAAWIRTARARQFSRHGRERVAGGEH